MKKIAIIIVGYNSRSYLEDLFTSIFASGNKKFTVFFVDNASSDGSKGYVSNTFRQVKVIPKKNNLGFAVGSNIGIKAALLEGCDYLFLLNADTVIAPDCLEELLKVADQKTILQPILLLDTKKKTNYINTSGNYLNFLGFSYVGDYCRLAKEVADGDITAASGACLWLPKQIVEKVGLFDETFFMYHEDLDLNWRARLLGFNVRLVSKAKVWHAYSYSRNKQKLFWAERNRLIFMLKNFELKTLLLIFPAFLLTEVLMILYALSSGWLVNKIRSYGSTIRLLGQTLASRRIIQKRRLISDRQLKQFVGAKLEFSEQNSDLLRLYHSFLIMYWRAIYKLI